jgi:hypothetical protein
VASKRCLADAMRVDGGGRPGQRGSGVGAAAAAWLAAESQANGGDRNRNSRE